MGRLTQYSAPNLSAEAQVDSEKWNQQPSASIVVQAVENIQRRGLAVIRAHNDEIALERLKELIPPGAELMSGASTTLARLATMNTLTATDHDGTISIALSSQRTTKKRGTSCVENLLLLITSSPASTPSHSQAKLSRATSRGVA
jgi:hypothetical protein